MAAWHPGSSHLVRFRGPTLWKLQLSVPAPVLVDACPALGHAQPPLLVTPSPPDPSL